MLMLHNVHITCTEWCAIYNHDAQPQGVCSRVAACTMVAPCWNLLPHRTNDCAMLKCSITAKVCSSWWNSHTAAIFFLLECISNDSKSLYRVSQLGTWPWVTLTAEPRALAMANAQCKCVAGRRRLRMPLQLSVTLIFQSIDCFQ